LLRGRFVNFISGINGVAAGAQAITNLPVNQRYHRMALQFTDAGNAAAVTSVIDSIKLIVNGVSVRDILPANLIRIAQAQGYFPKLGELPIFFTEPYVRNVIEPGDAMSWDMFGQSSFQVQIAFKGGITPGVTGAYEFDFLRNLRPGATGPEPFLQAVAMHQFTQQVVVGRNDINTLPWSFPIRRLWFKTVTAGAISQLEIFQDGNKVFEATAEQIKQIYNPYGFAFRQTDITPFVNATGPAALGVAATLEGLSYFDAAYISDPDYRWWKALRVAQNLTIRTTNTAAEAMTIVAETIPGIYAS
jgi:hypothetical protein